MLATRPNATGIPKTMVCMLRDHFGHYAWLRARLDLKLCRHSGFWLCIQPPNSVLTGPLPEAGEVCSGFKILPCDWEVQEWQSN